MKSADGELSGLIGFSSRRAAILAGRETRAARAYGEILAAPSFLYGAAGSALGVGVSGTGGREIGAALACSRWLRFIFKGVFFVVLSNACSNVSGQIYESL